MKKSRKVAEMKLHDILCNSIFGIYGHPKQAKLHQNTGVFTYFVDIFMNFTL